MPETITLHALDLSGETTLKLFLRKDDGTLLNTGGDDLAEIGSSGVFAATLAEARTGLGDLSYRVCLTTETADNLLIDGFLPETETTIGASSTSVLDSASVNAVADQVWDEATSGHTTAGTYGGRIVRATNSNTEVQITGANHIAADVHAVQPNGLSGSTEITNIENASGYLLAVLAGACPDPQTASETYAITVFGSTFTVDMAGQTSTGTRTAPTLTKT